MYPSIPWLDILNNLLSGVVVINETEVINVEQPEFLASLEKILINYNSLSPRVLANYAVWRVIKTDMWYLNEAINNRTREYQAVFTGTTKYRPKYVYVINCFISTGYTDYNIV